jgi:acetoin utilization deacetylase AcuC-like enzyme
MSAVPLVYHPDYVVPLPPEHRFPMPKFGKIYDILLSEGIARPGQFNLPPIASRAWLEQVHTTDYVGTFLAGSLEPKAQRRIGLPWSPALVKRTCAAVGGTVLTARLALQYGLACNTAGGTHHAFPDFGSGFCIFNDLAVATRLVQNECLAARVLIVDLDVHQGDGTAVIFQDDHHGLRRNFSGR